MGSQYLMVYSVWLWCSKEAVASCNIAEVRATEATSA